MSIAKSWLPVLGLVLLLCSVAAAQETQTPAASPSPSVNRDGFQPRVRRGERMMRAQRMEFGRRLNLSDEQIKQGAALRQKFFIDTKGQREQLFQLREKRLAGTFTDQDKQLAMNLRREMRTAMMNLRQARLNTLTPEQRTQFDSLQQERRARREKMMERRRENLRNRPIN